ncbi:hypothetical protein HOB06_01025 [archaeon]|jgi:hypothetical protein|nr:hypothetical protein [archaeon]
MRRNKMSSTKKVRRNKMSGTKKVRLKHSTVVSLSWMIGMVLVVLLAFILLV